MKGFGKILFGFAMVTAALLLYVHERVEMLEVSYQIQAKSAELSQKAEEFRRLNFEVAQIRSPQNLEKRISELSLSLTLPQEIHALPVPESMAPAKEKVLPIQPQSPKLFNFFGQWIQIAQARTDQ